MPKTKSSAQLNSQSASPMRAKSSVISRPSSVVGSSSTLNPRSPLFTLNTTEPSLDNNSVVSSSPSSLSLSQNRRYSTSHGKSKISPPPYKSNSPLRGQEKKFCDCTMSVEANRDKYGKGPYNDYAVCAKSTRTTSRRCSQYYDFEKMTDQQIRDYLRVHRINLPGNYSRMLAIKMINEKLAEDKKKLKHAKKH